MPVFLMILVAIFFCGIFASIIWLIISLIRRRGFKKPLISAISCLALTILFSVITANTDGYQEYLANRPEETEEIEESVDESETNAQEEEDEVVVAEVQETFADDEIEQTTEDSKTDENKEESASDSDTSKKDTNKTDSQESASDEISSQYDKLTQDIGKFDYEIQDNKVYLTEYSKRKKVLIVQSSYDIDGTTYETDLSEFRITSSKVEFVILEDGITNINTGVFNNSNVKYIYFPQSMELVYDYTLSYLHADDDETIQVYYGGSEDSWNNIFTEYERQTVSEAWNSTEDSEEKGAAVGQSVADKLNQMMGEYEADNFSYSYSVSQDDIKEIAVGF